MLRGQESDLRDGVLMASQPEETRLGKKIPHDEICVFAARYEARRCFVKSECRHSRAVAVQNNFQLVVGRCKDPNASVFIPVKMF